MNAWCNQIIRILSDQQQEIEELRAVPVEVPRIMAAPWRDGLPEPWVTNGISSITTLLPLDLNTWHIWSCTSASSLILPSAVEGSWVGVFNYGAQAITVQNPTPTTIGTVRQYEWAFIQSVPNSSGVPSWPSGIVVFGVAGTVRLEGDLVINDVNNGLILKDSAGTPHFWRVQVSSLGVLTTTDLGTSQPVEAEPLA